jgi:hypothetical protein
MRLLPTLNVAVLALKSLQKSMIFRPACPSAGPTGGDGLAWPALMTRRIVAATVFGLDMAAFLRYAPVWLQVAQWHASNS